MKVLLISPLPKLDPPCGDITYTETLLAYPPDGVEYETYAEALARGTLCEHGTGKALKAALREKKKSVAREISLTVVAKAINFLRKRRWLFWEPFRFFSVKPGEYDLIHLHVFSARFLGLPCPLVVSSGSPQRDVYRDARRQSEIRVRLQEFAEEGLGRLCGVNANSYHLPQASRVMVYTQYYKDWFVRRHIMPPDRVDIVPLYLPSSPTALPSARPRRVGFVAKDFAAKGGPTLLRAWERVRTTRPDAELWIAGSPPQMSEAEAASRGITWTPYIPRPRLLEEVIPSFDVFAYPTNYDCISYIVLEVMSRGIAISTTDYPSMPETVDHGQAGLISPVGNAEVLADNVLRLLEPGINAHYRMAAREHFQKNYSATAVQPQILKSYRLALNSKGHMAA